MEQEDEDDHLEPIRLDTELVKVTNLNLVNSASSNEAEGRAPQPVIDWDPKPQASHLS